MPVPGGTIRRFAERRLRPAEQLVALAVALVLALDVEGERVARAEAVDLDGVVDDEIGRDERVDARRDRRRGPPSRRASTARSTTAGTPVRSCRITRDGMNGISASAATPGRQAASVSTSAGVDDPVARVAEQVLEEDPDGDRQARLSPVDAGRRRSTGRRPAARGRVARGRRRGRSDDNASILHRLARLDACKRTALGAGTAPVRRVALRDHR